MFFQPPLSRFSKGILYMKVEPRRFSRVPEFSIERQMLQGECLTSNLYVYLANRTLVVKQVTPEGKLVPGGNTYDMRKELEQCESVVIAISQDEYLIAVGTQRGRVFVISRDDSQIVQVNPYEPESSRVYAMSFQEYAPDQQHRLMVLYHSVSSVYWLGVAHQSVKFSDSAVPVLSTT